MLELDVVPERSLGCEQWEFILGMYCITNSYHQINNLRISYYQIYTQFSTTTPSLVKLRLFLIGMHFSQAVAIIQSQVGIIKGVQVHYSDTVSSRNHFHCLNYLSHTLTHPVCCRIHWIMISYFIYHKMVSDLFLTPCYNDSRYVKQTYNVHSMVVESE